MKDITEDIYFTNFINTKNLSQASNANYKKTLRKFTRAVNTPLGDIINNCKNQQDRIIEKIISKGTDGDGNQIIEKKITRFDVNSPESLIKQYFDTYIEYCRKKGNSNNTINVDLDHIKTLLKFYSIEYPKTNIDRNNTKWTPLTKEDIKYIMDDSTIAHQSLIGTLKDSGLRLGDALKLIIDDFMIGTREYHNFIDAEDFIDNAPEDMICTLELTPHKTKRFNIPCVTCIGPDTCNLILQNLRRIKTEYFPVAKRRYGIDLTFSKEDALFGNRNEHYKGHMKVQSVADIFTRKNKKFRKWKIAKIDDAIKNNKLSIEDRDKEIEKIPKFHAHALRKFFQTTIAKNCGNLRLCTLMEGHVPPVKTDPSYIHIAIEDVKEVYLAALPDLSLENVEAKVYTSEIRKEMEIKLNELENKNKELESKLDEYSSFEERLRALEENRPKWDNII